MISNTRRPSLEQQRAAPAAARGINASPALSAAAGFARADKPYYFPNQHQRSLSSEVSNKQLPALPRDGQGYGLAPGHEPGRAEGGRGRSASASGGSVARVAGIRKASHPAVVVVPPAGHKKSNSSLSSAETQAGDFVYDAPPLPRQVPKPPPKPPTPNPTPKQSPNPSAYSSAHSRTTSQQTQTQTRYMNMLLTLDKIPRIHNILASFFTWILLAGFVIFPAAFTSAQGTGVVLSDTLWAGLLGLAAGLAGLGVLGMLWLGLFWRRNYIWLLNRLYMPGTLNGLAGAIATLTAVYAQHRGHWSNTALVAIAVEAAVFASCGVLFVVYNNLLLGKVKRQHQEQSSLSLGGKRGRMSSFMGSMSRMSRKPPFAPGSVV